MKNLPKLIKFLVLLTAVEVIVLTLFRVAFFFAFLKYGENFSYEQVLYSFWLGFRFDLQLVIIINLPILLLSPIPIIGIFKSLFAKYFWLIYILLSNIFIIIIYIINFAYYDFFKKMVDSSIIRYFYDIKDALTMVKEGYPLISVSIISFISFVIIFIFLKKLYESINSQNDIQMNKAVKRVVYTVFVIIYIFLGYGKFELYPWRWSEAFYSTNTFLSYLASNPVTYFVNTLKNTDVKYDSKKVKKYYDALCSYLDITNKDPKKLHFIRVNTPHHTKEYTFKNPNIVIFLGESTSYARSSISGNPLNPTPFLKYMSDNGVTFSRYYTPHAGTARSVWCLLTGLPDVERMRTSSRNPMVVQQHMILNSIKGYNKFYFIGGSLSWGNVRGVISNIDGIKKFEEHNYKNSPHNDVWGISDVHLAGEVNEILKKQTKPFIAIVHLSGNHSPNTIPDENFGFKKVQNISKQKLMDYSFDGKIKEYNGQRFLDHSVKRLITLAKKEKYFDNTIFIFVGDHGLPKKAKHMHEAEQVYQTHTIHTPLIFYAPKLLKHKKIDYPVSEVDIMATIAGLIGQPYINSSLGRDIFDKDFKNKEHYAFYMTHEANPRINLIGKEFIFRDRADGSKPRLYKYYFDKKNVNLIKKYPKIAKRMSDICHGIYEATRYIRFNNSTELVKNYLKDTSKIK